MFNVINAKAFENVLNPVTFDKSTATDTFITFYIH